MWIVGAITFSFRINFLYTHFSNDQINLPKENMVITICLNRFCFLDYSN